MVRWIHPGRLKGMHGRFVGRWLVGVVLAAAAAAVPAGAETEYGGLDFSGFSAWGSMAGAGANATAGIPFGPSQRSRRTPAAAGAEVPPQRAPEVAQAPLTRNPQAPAQVPSPPANALPAAAPPPDPFLSTPLLGGPALVDPSVMSGNTEAAPLDLPGAPAPAFPAPVTPAPGYGSPSLGYGPPVSYAPRPEVVPPTAIPPVTYAPPAVLPPTAPPEFAPTWRDLPEGPENRFYLANIVGADFATLSAGDGPNASGPLFTTGGAVGVARERRQGWLRTEFEARYRDPVADTFVDPLIGTASVSARDGWSTMVNVWRDFEVSDRFGVYLGGGIGGGGYRVVFDGAFPVLDATLSGSTSVAGFAWQAGTGATWLVTDRVALDLGYRWYAIDGGPAQITLSTPGFSFSDSVSTNFGANELLFTIRIYDPFRRWGE